MSLQTLQAYDKRPVRFVELWHTENWRIKVYSIRYQGERVDDDLMARAKYVLADRLRTSGPQTDHFSVGYMGVHQGRGANFCFIGWWANENELHYHVYNDQDSPGTFRYGLPHGPVVCVWDAALMAFERQAWVDWVLKNEDGPDIEGYLSEQHDMMV